MPKTLVPTQVKVTQVEGQVAPMNTLKLLKYILMSQKSETNENQPHLQDSGSMPVFKVTTRGQRSV